MDQQIYSESVAAILSYKLPQIKHFGREQASGQVQFLPWTKNYNPIILQTLQQAM